MRKYWVVGLASLALAVMLCEYRGDILEKKVRFGFYNIFLDSFPDYAPNFTDAHGIPVTFYPTQNGITPGYQYNGTIVANYAIDYYHTLKSDGDPVVRSHFYNCISWLDSAVTDLDGQALYIFDWRQPWYLDVGKPFTSGMTSGRAIEAFTYAFQYDQDSSHLHTAARLVGGYDLPIEKGGFTYKEKEGWWYEEIADTNLLTPRILDGHIFALTGLYQYYMQTNDSLAGRYFDLGLAALKAALPAFDRGDGFVYYDAAGKLADENYHPLLVKQMQELYLMTNDPMFDNYYKKWGAPLWQPYMVRIWKNRNKSGWLLFFAILCMISVPGFLVVRMVQHRKNEARIEK